MVNISDRTVSSVIGVPSPTSNTNDFGWAGGGTRVDGVIPPTPEPNLVKRFVALNSLTGKAFYSSDATSWEASDGPTGVSYNKMAYGNNRYVGVSRNSNFASSSADGLSWTSSYVGDNWSGWSDVAYGNGKFVAVGWGYLNNSVSTSTDGVAWTPGPGYALGVYYNPTIAYGNGKFVAMNFVRSYTSSDGVTWTQHSLPITGDYTVAYGNGKFVAVRKTSSTNPVSIYSTDGETWYEGSTVPVGEFATGLVYGDGKFVSAAQGRGTAHSIDGVTWTQGSDLGPDFADGAEALAYGNGKFVAVSYAGQSTYFYSTDGITWTKGSFSDSTAAVVEGNGIAYGEWPQVVI